VFASECRNPETHLIYMPKPRLLVSLFNAEEVRAATTGGADIIDCEDARAEVGMFKPRTISDIAFAVRQNENGQKRFRISANIGFGLLLYRRSFGGGAVSRTLEEIQAKAAQETLGMAAAMDTGDHRPNIVKFGIDGLHKSQIAPVVRAVKNALAESYRYQDHQIVCGMLETNDKAWLERKTKKSIIDMLLNVNQFYFDEKGDIDVVDYIDKDRVKQMMQSAGATTTRARLIDPYEPGQLGLDTDPVKRLKERVEAIAEGGADGVMIDTPVSAKAARICLVEHEQNKSDVGKDKYGDKLPTVGVFNLDVLKQHSDYCQYHYMECWLAGSIQPFHARALSQKINTVDVILCRGAASSDYGNPFATGAGSGSARFERRIDPEKVAKMTRAIRGQ
jgi:hypothetical protein